MVCNWILCTHSTQEVKELAYSSFWHNPVMLAYDGPDVTPFIHTLMCVMPKKLFRTTLNLTHMLTCEEGSSRWVSSHMSVSVRFKVVLYKFFCFTHMSVCMKGVTSGPSYLQLSFPVFPYKVKAAPRDISYLFFGIWIVHEIKMNEFYQGMQIWGTFLFLD